MITTMMMVNGDNKEDDNDRLLINHIDRLVSGGVGPTSPPLHDQVVSSPLDRVMAGHSPLDGDAAAGRVGAGTLERIVTSQLDRMVFSPLDRLTTTSQGTDHD